MSKQFHGQCDCCGKSDQDLWRTTAYGIETFICEHCADYDDAVDGQNGGR